MIRTEHREDKFPFAFVKYEPKVKEGKLPLIIQLHGAGERGDGKDELSLVDVHGFPKIMAEEYPAIFLMPQCPKDSFWAARVESIIKFIELAIEEYGVDRSRVYLTGLSMGGFGTWYTAMARPDLFSAIAPACGGGMAWNADMLDMPVWAFHGDMDTTVTPIHSEEMVEKLKKLGKDVRYTVFKGVAHGIQTFTFTKELIFWLISQKRG